MTSTYRKDKKKKKAKRKLRRLTSIMPMLEWRPDLSQTHMFRMPFKVGGIKDLQLHTPIKSGKKKVWANVYQKLAKLPHEIYMKNIKFGFIPKFQDDKHKIIWVDQEIKIPISDIISLAFKGTAIYYDGWVKTYNPYTKYNKFIINTLRRNKRLQESFPYVMQSYKSSGEWEKILAVKKEIWDIVTDNSLKDMWYYFNCGNFGGDTINRKFTIPNPIPSVRIIFEDVPYFNFLLNKDIMKRHQLQDHISLAPKSSSQEETKKSYEELIKENDELLTTAEDRMDFNRYVASRRNDQEETFNTFTPAQQRAYDNLPDEDN